MTIICHRGLQVYTLAVNPSRVLTFLQPGASGREDPGLRISVNVKSEIPGLRTSLNVKSEVPGLRTSVNVKSEVPQSTDLSEC